MTDRPSDSPRVALALVLPSPAQSPDIQKVNASNKYTSRSRTTNILDRPLCQQILCSKDIEWCIYIYTHNYVYIYIWICIRINIYIFRLSLELRCPLFSSLNTPNECLFQAKVSWLQVWFPKYRYTSEKKIIFKNSASIIQSYIWPPRKSRSQNVLSFSSLDCLTKKHNQKQNDNKTPPFCCVTTSPSPSQQNPRNAFLS